MHGLGNDVLDVHQAVAEARGRALAGDGPTLIECKTYRHSGHSTFDKRRYRPQEEMEAWLKRDPIKRLERMLTGKGVLDDNLVEEIVGEVREQMDDAVAFALNSPDPPPEAAADLVYCLSEGA